MGITLQAIIECKFSQSWQTVASFNLEKDHELKLIVYERPHGWPSDIDFHASEVMQRDVGDSYRCMSLDECLNLCYYHDMFPQLHMFRAALSRARTNKYETRVLFWTT